LLCLDEFYNSITLYGTYLTEHWHQIYSLARYTVFKYVSELIVVTVQRAMGTVPDMQLFLQEHSGWVGVGCKPEEKGGLD